ncbi:hypothetical protein CDAR_497061 [Caerostris darwini]|uniref:Uncharacterized protein n=1 Tax=Caerostris darwini TaxID=1538125 RepID=A0AAV4RYY5_9ARAC|nr:hypothetical protein CDAR_497061 [Caerostris darwini]
MNVLAEISKMEEHTLRSAGDNPLKFSLNLSFLVTVLKNPNELNDPLSRLLVPLREKWQLRAYGRKVRPDWRYAGLKLGPVVSDNSDKNAPNKQVRIWACFPTGSLLTAYQATDYFNYSK